jgi:hypothetical protein
MKIFRSTEGNHGTVKTRSEGEVLPSSRYFIANCIILRGLQFCNFLDKYFLNNGLSLAISWVKIGVLQFFKSRQKRMKSNLSTWRNSAKSIYLG